MATFYIDLENGNDASAGTSWATAWKTITSGATAARIAPGDEIRIAKSPDPISIGNATWTNVSTTVTLATAQTANIYLDGAWTAANTATTTTTVTRKEGSNATQITTPATTNTSTLYAYLTVGGASGLDLSTYDAITFWFRNNTTAVADANRYTLRLCSDTLGVTAVDTFAIPAIASTSNWVPFTLTRNGGGNLGSAIKSIALYTGTSSPGNSQQIWIDNVLACDFDGLNLTSLISKSSTSWNQTESWYPLQSIDGTNVQLGCSNNLTAGANLIRGYYTSGTSPSTVTTYIQKTTKLATLATSTTIGQTINDSGTSGNLISFIGGWDTVSNTRNGLTFIDGQNGIGYGIYMTSKPFVKFQYLSMVRYSTGIFQALPESPDCQFDNLGFVGNTSQSITGAGNRTTYTNIIASANGNALTNGGFNLSSGTNGSFFTVDNVYVISNSGNFSAFSGSGGLTTTVKNIYIYNCGQAFSASSTVNLYLENITIDRCSATTANTINLLNNSNLEIYNLDITNSTTAATVGIFGISNTYATIYNADVNSTSPLWTTGTSDTNSYVTFRNSNFTGSTIMPTTGTISNSVRTTVVGIDNATATKYAASVDYYNYVLYAFQQTTTVHTAGSKAWQINVLNTNVTSTFPYNFPIAKIAVNANSLVTFKAWVKKSHATDIGAKLIIKKQQVAGITSDVTATKTNDTNWEELTLTFTPTETGVVEIILQAFWLANLADESIYVDDITIQQA